MNKKSPVFKGRTAIYKGRQYRIGWHGMTRRGSRAAKLEGSGDFSFWADVAKVTVLVANEGEKEIAKSEGFGDSGDHVECYQTMQRQRQAPTYKHRATCEECGRPATTTKANNYDGEVTDLCGRCSRLDDYR